MSNTAPEEVSPDLSTTSEEDSLESTIEWSKLQIRKGYTYITNTNKPYTGGAKTMHDNGQFKSLAQFKDGKIDGLMTVWRENGQRLFVQNHKNGKQDGLRTKWYKNGQKEYDYFYKDGKQDGLATYWYENGQRKFVQKHKDGKPVGVWIEWYENGKASEQTNYKDGRRISVEVWKPNGERCPETNFINGTGTIVNYRQNGQRLFVQNHKNGKLDGLWIQYGVDGTKVQEAKFKNGLREWIH